MPEHLKHISTSLQSKLDRFHWIGWLLIFFVFLVAIALILAYARASPPINDFLHAKLSFREAAAWGQLGDFMGGILNSVISACTLAVAVIVWNLQKTELKKTADAMHSQQQLQSQQISEQTFFNLLELRAAAVSTVEWHIGGKTSSGHSAIKAILKSLNEVASNITVEEIEADLSIWEVDVSCPDLAKPYVALFTVFYTDLAESFQGEWLRLTEADQGHLSNLENEFGHVFRATYQVLKFVYECGDFDTPKKLALSNYLRAQMSETEFALYALTALTSIGRKSRAICIAFDFYQNRLLSTPWAKGLPELFDPRKENNARLAKDCDFPPLVPVSTPC